MAKTVKVRVAVAVDMYGNWSAAGWSNANGEDMDIAIDMVNPGEARYYLVAELPVPDVQEIEAKVEHT